MLTGISFLLTLVSEKIILTTVSNRNSNPLAVVSGSVNNLIVGTLSLLQSANNVKANFTQKGDVVCRSR